MRYRSKSVHETKTIAKLFAKKLKAGDTVALYGDLGSGKTTFVQGIASGLGIKRRIPSPSYVLIREYSVPTHPDLIIQHVDLYRLESSQNLYSVDLEEILENRENITLVEWAQRAENILPKNCYTIYIKYISEKQREIIIKSK